MSASFGTKSFPFCYEAPGDRERNIVFGRPGRHIRGRPAAFPQILVQFAIFQKVGEQSVARFRNQTVQFVQVLTFHAQPQRKAFGDPISALRTLLRHPLQGGYDLDFDFSHGFARRLGAPCGHRHGGFSLSSLCPPYGDEGRLSPSYASRQRHRNTGCASGRRIVSRAASRVQKGTNPLTVGHCAVREAGEAPSRQSRVPA